MHYKEGKIIGNLSRKSIPLITKVPLDEYTSMVQKNFDYEFDGNSTVYPFEMPNIPNDFRTMCIVGASGSGKSTLLKEFANYNTNFKKYDTRAIVSNFISPSEASERLSAVGLNSMPVWCRPRNVLSIGEGFRADLALNLNSYTIFDEFTSTIDRNVAKSTCNGIRRFINDNNLHNIIFCSCHSDYIPFLKPDLVLDLDEEVIYDCREIELGELLPYKYTSQMQNICGEFLKSITI